MPKQFRASYYFWTFPRFRLLYVFFLQLIFGRMVFWKQIWLKRMLFFISWQIERMNVYSIESHIINSILMIFFLLCFKEFWGRILLATTRRRRRTLRIKFVWFTDVMRSMRVAQCMYGSSVSNLLVWKIRFALENI